MLGVEGVILDYLKATIWCRINVTFVELYDVERSSTSKAEPKLDPEDRKRWSAQSSIAGSEIYSYSLYVKSSLSWLIRDLNDMVG